METRRLDSTFLPLGTLLSLQYKIVGHIGAGGFGKTYLVEDQLGNKKVVKEFFISTMCTRDAITNSVTISVDENRATFNEQLEKFRREARRINTLSHPNVVKVSGLFEENNTAYYVMDYVEGESLAQKYNRERLTEPQIVRYMYQLLDAVEYVHSKGLLHLDIKPGNIMIDRNDNVVLIDFGASKIFNSQSVHRTLMSTNRPPFTPGFAPIEQESGNVIDIGQHTDIYAIGATLYTLYMCKSPEVPYALYQRGFPQLPNASHRMQQVIKHSMEFMYKDRIKTVAEFRKVLGERKPVPTPPWPKGLMVTLLVVLLCGAASLATYFIVSSDKKHEDHSPEKEYVISEDLSKEEDKETLEQAKPTNEAVVDPAEEKEVDLGLPSGTIWAAWNVGASSPEDYGDYFAWGELHVKSRYTRDTYRHYSASSGYKSLNGNIVGSEYDVVRYKWGGDWRLPTHEEFKELNNKCRWTWTSYNGQKGYKVTGPNGRSIFLPACGYRNNYSIEKGGGYGYYWSGTLDELSKDVGASYLHFSGDNHEVYNLNRHYFGYSVRPVKSGETVVAD